MSETTLYTWLAYRAPVGGKVMLEVEEGGRIVVTVLAEEEPPPPAAETVSGKVVAGDIIFDTDIDAYVLKDVELEALPVE